MASFIQSLLDQVVRVLIDLTPLILQIVALVLIACVWRPIRLRAIRWFHHYIGWRGIWVLVIAIVVLVEAMKR
jgi:hypothetical protein